MRKVIRIFSYLLASLFILALSSCPEAGTGVTTLLGTWVSLEDTPEPEPDALQMGFKAGMSLTFNANGTYSCSYEAFDWGDDNVPRTVHECSHSGMYSILDGSLTSAPTRLSVYVTAVSGDENFRPGEDNSYIWYVNTIAPTLLFLGTDTDGDGIADLWQVAVRP